MKKNLVWLGLVLLTMFLAAGCTTEDWTAVAGSLNQANNDFANSYSSASESGMNYTIYNRSSQTVRLEDSTGWITIAPGGSVTARFNKNASIYDVTYSPSSVKVSQSGYSFTFTN
jgi:hypothetical protein